MPGSNCLIPVLSCECYSLHLNTHGLHSHGTTVSVITEVSGHTRNIHHVDAIPRRTHSVLGRTLPQEACPWMRSLHFQVQVTGRTTQSSLSSEENVLLHIKRQVVQCHSSASKNNMEALALGSFPFGQVQCADWSETCPHIGINECHGFSNELKYNNHHKYNSTWLNKSDASFPHPTF